MGFEYFYVPKIIKTPEGSILLSTPESPSVLARPSLKIILIKQKSRFLKLVMVRKSGQI